MGKRKKDPLLTLKHAKRLHEIKNSIQRFFKLLLTNRLTFLDGVGIANILMSVGDNLDYDNLDYAGTSIVCLYKRQSQ